MNAIGTISRVVKRVVPPRARRWLSDTRPVRWTRIRSRNLWVLAPRLRRQLSWSGAPAKVERRGARILIPLLETSHYQYYQILALAKALELRGATLRVLVCDSALDGCELKNSRRTDRDQCMSCRLNQRDLVGLFGLDVVRASEFLDDGKASELRTLAGRIAHEYPARFEHLGVEIIALANDSVTRFYYGDVPAEGSSELEFHRARHLYSALVGVEIAARLHREWKPTSLLGSMGVYADWGPYVRYFRNRGIPYDLVTMAPFDMRAVMVNYDELYSGTGRFERWRAARATPFLTADERKGLQEFLGERFSIGGGFERRWGWFEPGATNFPAAPNDGKRKVFLFANLTWDVGINYEGTLYDDVVTWVLDTVEALAGMEGVHLYVKTHPEESYGSAHTARGVADAIRERYPTMPENVTIIPPELKLRTYDLFPLIDLGVVYNSTVGLEMMLKDIPIVVAGAAPYSGHELATEPRSRDEYFKVLQGELPTRSPDPRVVELFAYFYFLKTQIPWRLTPTVYFDNFSGFSFERLDDLLPGRDPYLDHLCSCILDPGDTVIEEWSAAGASA